MNVSASAEQPEPEDYDNLECQGVSANYGSNVVSFNTGTYGCTPGWTTTWTYPTYSYTMGWQCPACRVCYPSSVTSCACQADKSDLDIVRSCVKCRAWYRTGDGHTCSSV